MQIITVPAFKDAPGKLFKKLCGAARAALLCRVKIGHGSPIHDYVYT